MGIWVQKSGSEGTDGFSIWDCHFWVAARCVNVRQMVNVNQTFIIVKKTSQLRAAWARLWRKYRMNSFVFISVNGLCHNFIVRWLRSMIEPHFLLFWFSDDVKRDKPCIWMFFDENMLSLHEKISFWSFVWKDAYERAHWFNFRIFWEEIRRWERYG